MTEWNRTIGRTLADSEPHFVEFAQKSGGDFE